MQPSSLCPTSSGSPRRCVFCHDNIPTVLTVAHRYLERERLATPGRPGIDDTYDLCWSCHYGLLHAGIVGIEEVQAAATATLAGTRKVTDDEVYGQIGADLAAGLRKIKWKFNDRTPEERSDAARQANLARTPEERSNAARQAWQHRSGFAERDGLNASERPS
jgi:hypothetical protein